MLEQLSKKVIQRIGSLLYASDKLVAALLPIRDQYDDCLRHLLDTRRTSREATRERT